MDNIENTLNRFKENYRTFELDDNFESQVFKKIKRKKTQRQVITSVTLAIAICALLFVAQGLLFHKSPEIKYAVNTEIKTNEKEEVPIMGEVIFSSSDRSANYAVQQVAFNENNAAY